MKILVLADRNSWAQAATGMLRKMDSRLAVYSSYELPEEEYLAGTWAYVLYISSSVHPDFPNCTGTVRYRLQLRLSSCGPSTSDDMECKVSIHSELQLLIQKFYTDNIENGEHYTIDPCCG